ncbi:MAG: FAD:protein FMN transferase [Candidatus Moraniibacteriota bacterium]
MNSIFLQEFRALGTEIRIFLVIDREKTIEDAKDILEEIKKIYQEKEKILSRFIEKSEISKLNSSLNIFENVSEDILHLAQKSLEYHKESEGYFDPRIIEVLEDVGYKKDFKANFFSQGKIEKDKIFPKNKLSDDLKIKESQVYFGRRMDFSGIAKGYITDLISQYLENSGWQNFLIDSGGDIFAKGKDEQGERWGIEVEGIAKEKIIINLENSAVATSGITRKKWEAGGEKYHHLINPMHPYDFSFDLKSVTVKAEICEKADVLAKVLYLMGQKKGMKYANQKKIPAIFLDYRGNIYLSEKMKQII